MDSERKEEKPKNIVLDVQSIRHVLTSSVKTQAAEQKEKKQNG
jgi:hypothetical protein